MRSHPPKAQVCRCRWWEEGGERRSVNTFPVAWEPAAAAHQHTDDHGRFRVVLYLTRGEPQVPPEGARAGGVSHHHHRGRERGHRNVPAAHQRQGAARRWAEHHALLSQSCTISSSARRLYCLLWFKMLQILPTRPTHQTTREPAPSSSTSPSQMVKTAVKTSVVAS